MQAGAGLGAGYADEAYGRAGATLAADAASVFGVVELIIKVKEPQPAEWARLGPGQILFTYLHLAPDPDQAEGLLQSGCTAIAYETVTDAQGGLPLLAPMSEVAGRIAVFSAAETLLKHNGGMGLLLCGVPGVPPARVCVLGGGVVGVNAARMAAGLGAEVVVLERSIPRMRQIDDVHGGPHPDPLLDPGRHRGRGAEGRRGDRRGADRRRRGAQAGQARAPGQDEARLGLGRRLHRPGRLFRDQPADHPRATRPMWSTGWCTTASPTCRGPRRAPRRRRWATPPCRSAWRWPTMGWRRRSSIRTWPRAQRL